MSKGNKYDIPVLIDSRLQKSEYQSPLDIVLYLDEDGKPYQIKNLIDRIIVLENEVNKLNETIVKTNDSLFYLEKEHNKLVKGYKKQITALKVQIATLGGKK